MISEKFSKRLPFIWEYMGAENAATSSKYDSNANVTQKNLVTLTGEGGKKSLIDTHREIVRIFLEERYGMDAVREYDEDLRHHIIYCHDESSILAYCCSISLYPFALDGLKSLGGTSCAPKRADSFIGGLVNLIYMVASQFAGAVAIPEFLTYFDHYIRIEYGDDYIEHLDDPLEIWGKRKRTLRDKIEDWFQQFVHSICEPAGTRTYQSPFVNIAYFDEYYFKSIFKDFVFPDGDEPRWESTKELQKMFMRWFNKERTREILTFPVETANILAENGAYKDEEMADFFAEMWAEGHSFFMYQSDTVDALASCCRLRNEIEENVFSTTMGAGGIQTGSKSVITMNLNRIIQDWDRNGRKETLAECIENVTRRVHRYLSAWNDWLWFCYDNNMLPIYKAGYIDLDKQYITVGVNSFREGAEYLGINAEPFDEKYRQYARDVLGTIKRINKEDRTEHTRYNTECTPTENAAVKLYNWDKRDGYWVPEGRNLYNSYFFAPEDETIDPVMKFYYQGEGFATECDGGVANHVNLSEHLTKEQYRKLMDVAVRAGCNYWTYNVPNTICNSCGHIDKRFLRKCPKCGGENLDYATRIIGYLKRISNFSKPRQIEASRRHYSSKKTVKEC